MSHPILNQTHGAEFTRIYSYGAARGDVVVPNEDLIGPIDSSDEWIQQRTGIITRTRASADVLAVDLATDAAREAIAKSGVAAGQIDLVIIATISNVQQTPSMAAVVADRVGSNPAAAYDTNAACAGFSYAVTQADALIRSGAAHYALVIGAEKLSDVVDPTDRSISFLLGDGAGAVVIGPSDSPGIAPAVWGSDGSKADAVGMNSTLTDFRDGTPSGRPSAKRVRPCSAGRSGIWQRSPSRLLKSPASPQRISPRLFPIRPTCASSMNSRNSSSCRNPS